MGYRVPPVITSAFLPATELAALRLDGEVFGIGSGFSPIDEIESMQHRCLSVMDLTRGRLIAEQLTAAWLIGVGPAPSRHQFCVAIGARARAVDPRRMTVREVVIEDTDVMSAHGLRMTTPLRTAVDLIRSPLPMTPEAARAIRALVSRDNGDLADCRAMLERSRNLPGRRRAMNRIEQLEELSDAEAGNSFGEDQPLLTR